VTTKEKYKTLASGKRNIRKAEQKFSKGTCSRIQM